jgi:site-specific DNA-methyltransferase (adenine-specific)
MKPYYEHAGITIYHGDCRDVLPGLARVRCCVTSPPYNHAIDSFKASGMHRETRWVKKISGGYTDQVDESEYQKQQRYILDAIADILEPDGSVFYNHKLRWRNGTLLHPVAWLAGIKLQMRQEIIWARNGSVTLNAKMFAPSDERIYWFDRGVHKWNQECVSYMSVWHIDQYGSFGAARGCVTGHPCAYPIGLPLRCIKATTDEGDTVLDPFCGSGTTLEAAHRLGRKFIGIEIEERYCEIAAKRLSQEVLDFQEAR